MILGLKAHVAPRTASNNLSLSDDMHRCLKLGLQEIVDVHRDDVAVKRVAELLPLVCRKLFKPEVEVLLHEVLLNESARLAVQIDEPVIHDAVEEFVREFPGDVAIEFQQILRVVRISASSKRYCPHLRQPSSRHQMPSRINSVAFASVMSAFETSSSSSSSTAILSSSASTFIVTSCCASTASLLSSSIPCARPFACGRSFSSQGVPRAPKVAYLLASSLA
ncbi:hypothetical protein PsYK624_045120 [Phanerochaete sordida]|uniref:Uncharacterized protein n=1 Tax=Phanerochaete sordida TaxID=48140 RepID=A0A9P3G6L1_9APHY|nr:hypothetical protein PsYK624_045120 [Phanerochaete sordida]